MALPLKDLEKSLPPHDKLEYHPLFDKNQEKSPENPCFFPIFPHVTRVDRMVIWFKEIVGLGHEAIGMILMDRTGVFVNEEEQKNKVQAAKNWHALQGGTPWSYATGWEWNEMSIARYVAQDIVTVDHLLDSQPPHKVLDEDITLDELEIDLLQQFSVGLRLVYFKPT